MLAITTRTILTQQAASPLLLRHGGGGPITGTVYDPWVWWDADSIARATNTPVWAVVEDWPIIYQALVSHGIADYDTVRAVLATIAIETAHTFKPVTETFWLDDAWRWANLRYAPFWGRGYIQLTWAYNYQYYGWRIGVDLLNNPELAKVPLYAGQVMAVYFLERGVSAAARAHDWPECRRLVQGAYAGLADFELYVAELHRLRRASESALPAPVDVYDFPIVGYQGPVQLHHGSFMGASDLFADEGTPIVTMIGGQVVNAGWSSIGGNFVLMRGDDGLDFYLAHGDRSPSVVSGQRVERNTYLFGVGETGNAQGTGPHLHIGIGHGILNGAGPTGGAGDNFDAVSLLQAVKLGAL